LPRHFPSDVKAKLADQGSEPVGDTPAELYHDGGIVASRFETRGITTAKLSSLLSDVPPMRTQPVAPTSNVVTRLDRVIRYAAA